MAKAAMQKPRVSVVIATHNYASFVGEAIESTLEQTLGDLELIIVDDGSTDGTPDVVRGFDDGRVRHIRREECSCSSDVARNDGFAIARADLIAILDGDDANLPDRLEKQATFLDRHPEIDILGGGVIRINRDGKQITGPILKPAFGAPEDYRQGLLDGELVLYNGTMMFRRRVLDRVPGYNYRASSGDFEFLLRASRYFRMHNLQEVLIYRRMHNASVTHTYGRELRGLYHQVFMMEELLWIQKDLERIRAVREGDVRKSPRATVAEDGRPRKAKR